MKNYAEICKKLSELRSLDSCAAINYQINRANGLPSEVNDAIQESMDSFCCGGGYAHVYISEAKNLNLLVQAGFTPVALKMEGMFKLTFPR